MTDEPTMVANPARAQLEEALAGARPVAAAAATALDDALAAMKGKAWVSSTADTFYAALVANDGTAQRAGQGCLDALQAAHDRAPEKVASTSLRYV